MLLNIFSVAIVQITFQIGPWNVPGESVHMNKIIGLSKLSVLCLTS